LAQDTHQRASAYLQTDPMRHLVHLKFLHLYPNHITCHYHEADGEAGVLLSHPTALVTKDREAYPHVARVFVPTASGEAAAEALAHHTLAQLAPAETIVTKFCDVLTRKVFESKFRLQYIRAVISFTADRLAEPYVSGGDVVMRDQLDETLASLYAQNGYSAAELQQFFTDQALSFTIYDQTTGEALSTCLAFRNFDRVWEIGAVRTVERAQRKGYGRRVVGAAVSTVLQNGWIPRYQSEETNTASIALAESLGLNMCLRFEHYLAAPCIQGNS
jgi:GNAT superfamily N-acetyltransferase